MATNTEDEVVADEPVEPKERSIREEIEAARDEINARESNHDGNERSPVPAETNDSGGTQEVSSGRQRGPDGKFARQADTGTGGGTEAVPAQVRSPTDPAASNSPDVLTQQHVALPAPQSWSAEEKKLWAQLPPPVQQVVSRREQETHRRITEHDEVRGVGNQFMTAANEYAPLIQARGGNPVALFRELLGYVNQIQNSDPVNRANIFRQLAAQNGVDLRMLGMPQQSGAQPQGQQQPNVPIDQLVNRAFDERFQAMQRQEAQQREAAERESVVSEIEAFRSKVNATGQPAYPYFNSVESLMGALLSAGNAQTLEEAYQLAVKAHPETSQLVEQAAQAAAKAKEEARRKADTARRKAGSLRTGAGSSPQANGSANRSIRDELQAAFEEARGRV